MSNTFSTERLKGIKKKKLAIFLSFESAANFLNMPVVPSIKQLKSTGSVVLCGYILPLGYQPPLFLHAQKYILIILSITLLVILINLLSGIFQNLNILPQLKKKVIAHVECFLCFVFLKDCLDYTKGSFSLLSGICLRFETYPYLPQVRSITSFPILNHCEYIFLMLTQLII